MSQQTAKIKAHPRRRGALAFATMSALVFLSACGGGGGGGEVIPPPPINAAELSVLVKPAGNPIPSSNGSQTLASIQLSNVGKGVAGTTDLSITADAELQDIKVLNCKSDNPGSVCPASGTRMSISNLQPGSSLSFDVAGVVKLGTSKVINLSASAMSTNGGQLSASNNSLGFKVYSVDVSVQATGPGGKVPAGGSFNYVVTVGNKGPDASSDAQLRIDLLSSPTATAPTLGTISCSASGGAVCPTELKVGDMSLPRLPKDGALVFTLPYSFAPGVTQSTLFNVSVRASADTDSSNNSVLIGTP